MKSKMPMLLAVVFVSWLSWAGEAGTPPQPTGDKSRFIIVAGHIENDLRGEAHPVMFRLDTWTGGCWVLTTIPLMQKGRIATYVPHWQPVQEADGDLVKTAQSLLIPAK